VASHAFAACGIANGPVAVSFGAYNPLTFAGKLTSSDVLTNSTITVSCTGLAQPVNYTLKLSAGRSNSVSTRSMGGTGGGNDMLYNLYTNPTYTAVWGDAGGGSTITGTLGQADGSNNHIVYGRIPGGQNGLRAGSYSDALVITLEYAP
jgi:spore coat protein U-like protein